MRQLFLMLVLLLAGACATTPRTETAPKRELVTAIVNGYVLDGTGAPPFRANLIVEGDTITRVIRGDLPSHIVPDVVLDADGRIVTPGFIDTHAHGDPLSTPGFENFLAMGVTTIALGQDGNSTPAGEMADWMRQVEAARPGPNVMTYIGHGTVRHESGVGLSPDPSPADIARMEALVEKALEAGAWGLTTGLEYQPGNFAGMEELIAVARPVAARDLVVMSHIRSEDDDQLIASIRELVMQGEGSGARVHVSHIKSVYGRGEARAWEILGILRDLREGGVAITADIYPYTASFTGLSLLFPDYALPPHDYKEVVDERRGDLAEYLYNRVAARNGPGATLLGTGPHAGKTLAELSDELGMSYEDVLIELGPRGGAAAYFVMDEDLQGHLLLDPLTNVCSDGSPEMRHPRGYGAFARIIHHYVNEQGMLSLPEAIHKMTGLPAETTGLVRQRRGLIAEGHAADLLIFDPREIRDTATFENPHQLAIGFDTILVNGVIIRQDGIFTGARAGKVLRHGVD